MMVSMATGSFQQGNVEHWIMTLEVFLEVIMGWNGDSLLRGDLMGCLDDIIRLMAKIRV